MRKMMIFLSVCMFIMSSAAYSQKLDEIIDAYLATKGQESLSKIQTIKSIGKWKAEGMELNYTQYNKRPDKCRIEVSIQGATMIMATDGKNYWTINPMTGTTDPQDLGPDEQSLIKPFANFDGDLFNWLKKDCKVSLLGTTKFDGTNAFEIQMIKNTGDTIKYYINTDDFSLLKEEHMMSNGESKMKMENYFSDYKQIDGVMFPFSTDVKLEGQTSMNIVLEKVELGKPIDDSIFIKPEPKKEEKKK